MIADALNKKCTTKNEKKKFIHNIKRKYGKPRLNVNGKMLTPNWIQFQIKLCKRKCKKKISVFFVNENLVHQF